MEIEIIFFETIKVKYRVNTKVEGEQRVRSSLILRAIYSFKRNLHVIKKKNIIIKYYLLET